MRCRCSDIEQEQRKLSKLEIQERSLASHSNYQVEIENDITNLKRYVISCMEDATPDAMQHKLYTITDDLEPLRKQISRNLSDKIDEVQAEISRMRSEDSAWHEEQRRIAEEQKRMADARIFLEKQGGMNV